MKNIVKLDVLVVYSASVAQSASVSDSQSIHPFLINSRRSNYNLSYAYFLDTCQKNGLTAGFTTSADIVTGWPNQLKFLTKSLPALPSG
ncbi:MAG: hypothetical protein UX63_C0003G0046 [Microgenomates group bacterium GW2011_GWB1_46_7]|nr:MAG: hypothetical protein UX63_C0003G0046 [Microgenomates group bacterium GW2011_GWB1_46_7]